MAFVRLSSFLPRSPTVLATALAAPLLLGGCYTLGIDHKAPYSSEQAPLSAGYALLHATLQEEAVANQVTRNVPVELQNLLDTIAGSALEFDATLQDYAKQNSWIDLEDTQLPKPDAERRSLDRQERRVDLLQQSGRSYNRLVLLTQWRILTEERNLARAQALIESDDKRKAFLAAVAARCDAQRTAVMQQLDLRYFSVG